MCGMVVNTLSLAVVSSFKQWSSRFEAQRRRRAIQWWSMYDAMGSNLRDVDDTARGVDLVKTPKTSIT